MRAILTIEDMHFRKGVDRLSRICVSKIPFLSGETGCFKLRIEN